MTGGEPREDFEALSTDMEEPTQLGWRWISLGGDGVLGTFPHFSECQFFPLSGGGDSTHYTIGLLY